MKLITRNTDYAVRALQVMAGNKKEIFSVGELVKVLGIPQPFLRKILQILHKNRILHSYKGKGGGFALACEPGRIFLVDLIEIFQGPLRINECIFKKRICSDISSCALNTKINEIERSVIQDLKSITIESLLY